MPKIYTWPYNSLKDKLWIPYYLSSASLVSSAFTLWFKPYTHSSGKEPMFSRSLLLLSFKCLSPSLPLSLLSCLNPVGLQDNSGLAPCKDLPQGPAPSLATSSMQAHCAHHLLLQWVLNFSALLLYQAPWGQCLHLIHLCTPRQSVSSICSIKYMTWNSPLKIIYSW